MGKSQTITIIALSVIIILALGYFLYQQYTISKQQQQITAAQIGYSQAIVDVAKLAVTCQVVPLTIGNSTINMISVECLQKAQQQQQQAGAGAQAQQQQVAGAQQTPAATH